MNRRPHPASRPHRRRAFVAGLALAGAAFLSVLLPAFLLPAFAQAPSYPSRAVRIISPFPTGSGPDAAARLLAERLAKVWAQPVIVDARAGASGFIAAEAVKNAAPDGHELLISDNGLVTISPSLFKKLPFDVERDYAPASLFFRTPFFIAVSPTGPLQTVPDLIAAARAKPGALSYGSPFIGSPSHLGSALFEASTQTQMIHVPFKETTQLFTAVASGDVTWALGTQATTGALVRAGKLRLMAVAAPRRTTSQPDVPTVAEAGGPAGYEVTAWVGLLARKGTPAATLDKIQRDVARALGEPELRDGLAAIGFEPLSASRDEFATLIRTDTQRNAELVRRAGAKVD